jgi:Arc/MetJ-type ribon-helix-helix transcriptional regulator
MAASKKNGMKWGPFMPRSSESMDAMQEAIPGELSRLKALPVQKMLASVGLVDDAMAAMASGQTTNASDLIGEALKAWPQNEEALRWKQEIAAAKVDDKTVASGTNSKGDPAKKAPVRHNAADAGKADAAPVQPPEKPFYMTIKGALAIAVGVMVIIGALTLLGRLQKPKGKSE